MKRRDAIKNLGLASAIPFLPCDAKAKVVEKPGIYGISAESIIITSSGKYMVNVNVVYEDLGSYGTARGLIVIRRKNKIPQVDHLFMRMAGKEPNTVYISTPMQVLDLREKDVITVRMKPKYLNIRECYIKCIMLSSN